MLSTSKSFFRNPSAGGGGTTDPSFAYVPLLLETTSTNGQQNNTFLDSSTNAFTITRNGTPTQGSITPYWPDGQWSNYFSANSTYLTAGSSTTLALGAGDFTIETWVYLTSYNSNSSCVFDYRTNGGSPANIPALFIGPSGLPALYTNIPSGALITGSSAVPLNTWTHLAIVRSGTGASNVKMYLNGTNIGSGTATNTLGIETFAINNAALSPGNVYVTYGYISNFRIVKGVAVYTTGFTPSTTPLTATQSANINGNPSAAITGTATSLLTCQSNRFKDNSSNNFTVTPSGSPTVQAFQPFSPAASYSAATYAGSGYFNGSTDYLSLASNAAFNIFGGDMTIDGWLYPTALAGRSEHFLAFIVDATNRVSLYFSGTTFIFWTSTSGGGSGPKISSALFPTNTWTHVALVKSGATFTLYINGISAGTSATTVYPISAMSLNVGTYNGVTSADAFTGYMSNTRIVKGTAVYTANFTPPTTPVTNITNTSLLLNMANAGIYDAAAQNNMITVGDAQVSTTQSQWPPSSMKFDGTGDWLTAIDSPQLQLGTGDFTIEGWVYLSAVGVVYGVLSKGTATTGWSVNVTVLNKLQFSYTASNLTGTTTLATGTWYYFAVVRSGSATGNIKLYLNGSVEATSGGAVTDNFNQTDILYVGASRTGATPLNGYLQDVRVTRLARTITTPTAAFPTR